MELFDRIGLADRFMAAGRQIHGLNFFSDGKRIIHLSIDQLDSRYNFALCLPQSTTEQFLNEHLNGLGVSIERGVELVDITQDQDGARALLRRSGSGELRVRVPWVVGCDGAHSSVRQALKIPFEGTKFDLSFSLADAQLDGHLPDDEATIRLYDGNVVAIFPMPGAHSFRIVVEHPVDSAPEGEPTLDEFQRTWTLRVSLASGLATPSGCRASRSVPARWAITVTTVSSSPATLLTSTRPWAARA